MPIILGLAFNPFYSPRHKTNNKEISNLTNYSYNYRQKMLDIEFSDSIDSLQLEEFNNKILFSIKNTAEKVGMRKIVNTNSRNIKINQPWFDEDCKTLKRDDRKSLKLCKKFNFNDALKNLF